MLTRFAQGPKSFLKVFGAHQVVWSEFYWSQRGLVGFALNPNYPADHLKALAAIHTEATPCREAEQSRAAAEETGELGEAPRVQNKPMRDECNSKMCSEDILWLQYTQRQPQLHAGN